jgi:hypothetical protein
MGAYIWPADAVSGAPSYTGRMLRQLIGALWGAKTAARPLGGTSGVAPGTPSTTVTASSTTWTVLPHAGMIDGETAAAAGPYMYSFDSNQTGSMTAANGSNPRIDLISVQISDPAESDGSSNPGVAIVYTTGTAAASPSPPATPARAIAIAQINVPTSGGGSPTVPFVAPVAVAAGGIRPLTTLPGSGYTGQYVDLQSPTAGVADGLYRWDGSAWQRNTSDSGAITSGLAITPSAGWGSLSYSYRIVNGVFYATLNATRTGADITFSATGGLADVTVATITDSALQPPWTQRVLFETGTTSGAASMTTAGAWAIRDGHPGSTIATSDTVQSTFAYPL